MEVVYKVTCLKNGRYYIGSSSDVDFRLHAHFKISRMKIKKYNDFHLDIKKYGIENFKSEILFQSYDKVEVSRMESKLVRENINDELIYNKSHGASGRRVFYEDDIKFIRKLYAEKNKTIDVAYDEFYKDIVTFRSFKKVWHGDTFKDIDYHVYTKENKAWHFSKGQSRAGEKSGTSILKEEDVISIRKRRDNGENIKEVFLNYKDLITVNGFRGIWFDRTWKYLI